MVVWKSYQRHKGHAKWLLFVLWWWLAYIDTACSSSWLLVVEMVSGGGEIEGEGMRERETRATGEATSWRRSSWSCRVELGHRGEEEGGRPKGRKRGRVREGERMREEKERKGEKRTENE